MINDNFPGPPDDKIEIHHFPPLDDREITFTLQGSYDSVIDRNLSNLIRTVFGDHPETDYFDDMENGEERVYTIIVEKKYTKKELDNMPESDGDIG